MEARRSLSLAGVHSYSPLHAFTWSPDGDVAAAASVRDINNRAVEVCDAILAEMWLGCRHVGTSQELAMAASLGKPCVVMLGEEGAGTPLALLGVDQVHLVRGRIKEGLDVLWWVLGLEKPLEYATDEQYEWEAIHRVRLKVQRISTASRLPTRHYTGDAGVDLYCDDNVCLEPNEVRDISTGIRVEMSPGYWGLIIGRSSTLRDRELLVNLGVIDNGWRGELFVNVRNLSAEDAYVLAGDRLAQLVLFPLAGAVDIEEVENLSRSERGVRGFGSTGE